MFAQRHRNGCIFLLFFLYLSPCLLSLRRFIVEKGVVFADGFFKQSTPATGAIATVLYLAYIKERCIASVHKYNTMHDSATVN